MRGNSALYMAGSLCVGAAIAVQGLANGSLAQKLGVGIYAATFSFSLGLVLIAIIALVYKPARAGAVRIGSYVFSGLIPWWIVLGGLMGGTMVASQAITVPIIGVTVFNASVVAGQLVGALVVDNTRLPPGGKKRITLPRITGVVIVLIGEAISTLASARLGFAWWWPLIPFAVGFGLAYQQAANGRVRVISGSTITATFVNFAGGGLFLGLISLVVSAMGAQWQALPTANEWWMLTGGILGVFVIGMSAFVVQHLGVLVMSLLSLLGNVSVSVLIDVLTGHANTALSPLTLVSLSCVLLGSVVVSASQRLTPAAVRARFSRLKA